MRRYINQYLNNTIRLMTVLMLVMAAMSANAKDPRIAEEVADGTNVQIPLIFAVGEDEYKKAMDSGEYKYTGNLKCRLCHRDFFLGRKKDVHEHTFRESIAKTDYEKEADCLACHTTGFGVPTGFVDKDKTRKLANVQCEGCHGPGSKHAKLDGPGGFLAGQDRPHILKKMCIGCHTDRWNKSYTDLDEAYNRYKEAEAAAGK